MRTPVSALKLLQSLFGANALGNPSDTRVLVKMLWAKTRFEKVRVSGRGAPDGGQNSRLECDHFRAKVTLILLSQTNLPKLAII